MTGEKTSCPHCGAAMVEHKHNLNVGLVRALEAAYRKASLRPFSVAKLNLDHNAHANFQKLGYWGLIRPYITTETHRKRGWWQVTPSGEAFLHGGMIERAVTTYRGKVTGRSKEAIRIDDVDPTYDYRRDYAQRARPLENQNQLQLGFGT